MSKLSVLVLFGGQSSEHDVSIASARNVVDAIDPEKYIIHVCYIDRNGAWWLQETWSDTPVTSNNNSLYAVLGESAVIRQADNRRIDIDVAFPVLHGKFGEDGTIQGLFEMMKLPYVGCGVGASALCMDKLKTKQILAQTNRVAVAPWIALHAADDIDSKIATLIRGDIEETLGTGPWFVKPSRAGSSVGVTRVVVKEDLSSAVHEAFMHDTTVLIEKGILGRELEVAVLGNRPSHRTSNVGEILAGEAFYSYEDKYAVDSASAVVLKADLPTETAEAIKEHAMDIFAELGCRGLSRVDFFLGDDGTVYLNEVNTMPGFTNIRMYPKLWSEQGLSYSQLVDRLIQLSLE